MPPTVMKLPIARMSTWKHQNATPFTPDFLYCGPKSYIHINAGNMRLIGAKHTEPASARLCKLSARSVLLSVQRECIYLHIVEDGDRLCRDKRQEAKADIQANP